jgi:hypothetical protein
MHRLGLPHDHSAHTRWSEGAPGMQCVVYVAAEMGLCFDASASSLLEEGTGTAVRGS